jgi:hypothetical protein
MKITNKAKNIFYKLILMASFYWISFKKEKLRLGKNKSIYF